MKSLKKYEVSVKEINQGYVIVEAENAKQAKRVATKKYRQYMVLINDEPEIKTKVEREISPIGFRCKRNYKK